MFSYKISYFPTLVQLIKLKRLPWQFIMYTCTPNTHTLPNQSGWDTISMSPRFFNLPQGIWPSATGPPIKVITQVTLYLPGPGLSPDQWCAKHVTRLTINGNMYLLKKKWVVSGPLQYSSCPLDFGRFHLIDILFQKGSNCKNIIWWKLLLESVKVMYVV